MFTYARRALGVLSLHRSWWRQRAGGGYRRPSPFSRGDRSLERWFDTSVFGRPARGQIGNGRKDEIRLPGLHNWDLTVFKRIPIRDGRRYFQLRWEMYNVFNMTQFNGVDTTARFNAAGQQVNTRFGQVISTRSPRIMQASLRIVF